jgi:hypothetical protein
MYNFGPEAGDSKMPSFDDHYIKIEMPIQFKFYNKHFSSLLVTTNGLVKLLKYNENITEFLDLHNNYFYNSAKFPIANER